ncbi:MAG: NAD(P)/FAD-dependent oxidoreductase [bacterium]|nr:NAD(P)/FAD-dependent oxidoreductase [bacterium]
MSSQENDFDLCIIGSGPAGYSAAIRAWDYGLKVCLIEKNRLGGAGIHHGALCSKTLWELSKDYCRAARSDRGYRAQSIGINFSEVKRSVYQALAEKELQMKKQLDAFAGKSGKNKGSIKFIHGEARFRQNHESNQNEIEILLDGAVLTTLRAKNYLVATGSSPRSLPDIVIDGERILSSDHIMNLENFPRSLVILGAGVIGCEFATLFANFAQTKVYLIDKAERILPFEDEDVARICSRNLEAKGVTIHHKAQLISMTSSGDMVNYTIEHPEGGRETICVEYALVAVGRTPNTTSIGLEQAGVTFDKSGNIVHLDTCSSNPQISAAGDVTMDMALVSIAEIEGRHAVEKIINPEFKPMSYQNVSTIMFLDPEVAAIGLNEKMAQEKRIPYKVATYSYSLVNRAIAMRATEGFVKLLVTNDSEMKILGMRALGVHASTTIEAASIMMHLGRPVADLADVLHPHPAITEALLECARMLCGTSIYKPEVFPAELRLSCVTYEEEK